MPLCKKSRQRERTCHEEHKYYYDDLQLGCREGRDSFVLPKEYRLYEQASGAPNLPFVLPNLPSFDFANNEALFESSDEDNRGIGDNEQGDIDDEFYSAESDSLDSTDEALCNAMEERVHQEAAKKRGKPQSNTPTWRRKQPGLAGA